MADDDLMAAIAAVECIYVSCSGNAQTLAGAAHDHLLKVDMLRDEHTTTLARLTADLEAQTKRAELAERDAEALGAALTRELEITATLTAERDEALADVAAAEAPLTDIVLRHHAAMSQVERERDEARRLLGEAFVLLDAVRDPDDRLGAIKVEVPDGDCPRAWLVERAPGLTDRIAAHLGRSE